MSYGNAQPRYPSNGPAPARRPVPLGPGWFRLGQAVRIALTLQGAVLVMQFFLFGWGLTIFEDAIADYDIGLLDAYDRMDQGLSVASFVFLLLGAVLWMVWQYRLAASTPPGELRREPGWHGFSWITPVVALWFPYQNIKDLWLRRFPQGSTAVLRWWWGGFVLMGVLDRIVVASYDGTNSVDGLISLVRVELAATVISLGALVLALRIHRSLSAAERASTRA